MKYRPRLNEEEYAMITKHRALQKECNLQAYLLMMSIIIGIKENIFTSR